MENSRTGRNDIHSSADIQMRQMMIMAREARNREAIQKLADKESNKAWGSKEEDKMPKFEVYKKCENIANTVGWRNLLRSLRP